MRTSPHHLAAALLLAALVPAAAVAQQAAPPRGVVDPNVAGASASQLQPRPAADAVPAEIPAGHPLAPAIEMAEKAVAAAEAVPTYTARLYRKVLLNGQFAESTCRMKYRTSPRSVYLYFETGFPGREAIWIEGWNNNQMYAHAGSGPLSLLGSLSLDPEGERAMEGSKNPITRSGLAAMGQTIVDQWRRETAFGEVDAQLFPDATLDGTACRVIETTHPQPRREFTFHKTRLFIAKDTGVPFAVQQLTWPRQPGEKPLVVEDYRYSDLNLNAGLTNADFDPQNPAYNF